MAFCSQQALGLGMMLAARSPQPHRQANRNVGSTSPSRRRSSGTRLGRHEAPSRLCREEESARLLAACSNGSADRRADGVQELDRADGGGEGSLAAARAVFEEHAESIYPNMIDRERAAALYMAKHRVATGSVADRHRDERRREEYEARRAEGVLAWLAAGRAGWQLPPCGAPGWLEPLAAAQLRLAVAMLLQGHAPPNLFPRPLLRDVDIAESVGLLLSSRAPASFTRARHNVVLTDGGTIATGGPYCWGSAVSASGSPMRGATVHYAEFQLCEHSSSNECVVGVAAASYDPCGGEPFPTAATSGAQAWGFNAWSGKTAHAGRESLPLWCTPADVSVPVGVGQTIGLLLDLSRGGQGGTLTMWVDGQRRGLLCSGISAGAVLTGEGLGPRGEGLGAEEEREEVGLRWMVELKSAGCHVKLKELPPPPPPPPLAGS